MESLKTSPQSLQNLQVKGRAACVFLQWHPGRSPALCCLPRIERIWPCENPAAWSEFNLHSALSNCLHIFLLHGDRGAHWVFNLHSNDEVLHNEASFESQRWGVVESTPGSSSIFSPLPLKRSVQEVPRGSRPLTPLWEHISNECSPATAWWQWALGNRKCSPKAFTSREYKPRNFYSKFQKSYRKWTGLYLFSSTPHNNSPSEDVPVVCNLVWDTWVLDYPSGSSHLLQSLA